MNLPWLEKLLAFLKAVGSPFMVFLPSFLCSLGGAVANRRKSFRVRNFPTSHQFLEFLRNCGFILGYVFEGNVSIQVLLPPLSGYRMQCRLISKASRRVYCSPFLLRKHFYFRSDLTIISTSRGLRSAQQAVLENLGGECLCSLKFY